MEPKTSNAAKDSEYDPFDFVAQYRRLEAARQKEKENLRLLKLKEIQDFKDSLLNFDKDAILAEIMSPVSSTNSNVTSTASSSGSAVNNPRGCRRKLNDTVVNSTVTSTASLSGSGVSSSRQTRRTLNKTPQTVNVPNTQENTTASTQENTTASTQPKRRRKQYDFSSSKIIGPVISIGDFDDGYDIPCTKPSTVTLTETDKNAKFITEDEDLLLEELNRIMNVKVYWRKIRSYVFPLRMFQSIESIFEHFAKIEDVKPSEVCLKLHDKVLKPTDSPHSFNYRISDFIDGEFEFYKNPFDKYESNEDEKQSEDEVKFRIKQKDVKHPFFMSIKKTDKMIVLFIQISEKLGLDIRSFSLFFDGDKIKWFDTIESLDLEGDECLELFEKTIKT